MLTCAVVFQTSTKDRVTHFNISVTKKHSRDNKLPVIGINKSEM